MNLTRTSISYFFLIIGLVAIAFYAYFKVLSIKSSPNSSSRDKIIGKMKDVDTWSEKNKRMEYVSLFWAIVSIAIFAFVKYFYTAPLVSIFFPFIYIALIVASSMMFMPKKRVFK
ncbi:hypothetical protein GCM10008905_12560 [Clostridium malenominatum]|uniref:DUF2178 domain-containing protein n=1 Tax=Clostridium malenominatum TaxID=1539 RepID=A0ABN1IVB2_9CLOT